MRRVGLQYDDRVVDKVYLDVGCFKRPFDDGTQERVRREADAVAVTSRRRRQRMSRPSMSLYEIRREGWKALTERLGAAGAMRFMMQYDAGYGDYAKERQDLFGSLTIDDPPQS
jgi:hypothetical protein